MKQLFRSRMIQQVNIRYGFIILLFIVLAAIAMVLSPAIAQASAPRASTPMGASVSSAAISSSCNQAICIQVSHSGLRVNDVEATAIPIVQNGCATVMLLVQKTPKVTKPICWKNDGSIHVPFPNEFHVNNGDKVCVGFKGPDAPKGLPCVTIHN